MTTASRPLATALWGARFAGDWLPSCYTTWGDTTRFLKDGAVVKDPIPPAGTFVDLQYFQAAIERKEK